MLTIQILVKNNQNTIEKTLQSIKDVKSKIIIADLGCTDDSIKICKKYTDLVSKIEEKNYAKIRNSLSVEGTNFYINPWETLVEGQEILEKIQELTDIYVFNNNVISKETRIWTSEKFVNPIYETIVSKKSKLNSNIIISSKKNIDDTEERISLANQWMKNNPMDSDPYYYLACCYLSKRNFEKFFFYANEYIIRENKTNASLIMMKYYMAQVKLHQEKVRDAAELALTCLSYYPSLAEFWCLLGDIYYKQNKLKKSKAFYENATIIGSQRKNDKLPIEIEKYKEYPEKMIKNIDEFNKKIEIFSN
jgi:tetratricopeptide (TPR) repeat protein